MTTATEPEPEAAGLPREGDILAGKFRIDRVLGQGGMGVVVAAEHTTLRQKVAVKFLLPEAMARADACDRFLREARAAVAIRSEHVARVTDVGTLDSGAPYMVMELLAGTDLGVVLQQRGPLPIAEAVDYLLQAGEAIAEAHSLGIIHRDLKPANLFLSARADGSSLIKVLDFGLSKVPKGNAMDASLTAANVIMGSPFYMSPEQVRSLKGLDARTDVWSLGVILYQLVTGVRPFDAEGLGVLFLMIGADPVTPPSAHRPDLPPGLEAVILRCLEKDPSHRMASVAELAGALAPFAPSGSRLSVERIQRTLGDGAAAPAPATERTASNPFVATAPLGSEATVLLPDALPPPPEPAGVKSGSIAAVASSVEEVKPQALAPGAAPVPARPAGRRGLVVGLVVAVALGAIAFASLRTRGRAPAGDPPAPVPAAIDSAVPAVPATASAVDPVVSAAPAVSAAPSASAPAAPTGAAPTGAPRKPAPPPRAPRKNK
jgi:serine/threonine-protein kinase